MLKPCSVVSQICGSFKKIKIYFNIYGLASFNYNYITISNWNWDLSVIYWGVNENYWGGLSIILDCNFMIFFFVFPHYKIDIKVHPKGPPQLHPTGQCNHTHLYQLVCYELIIVSQTTLKAFIFTFFIIINCVILHLSMR